jgi:4,5-dihydroxyphthalate decarboxylase
MLALYTGEVQAEGIGLDFIAIDDPRQIFDRMGKNLEFDACEMSSSEVISRHAAGRREMVALPVFPSRVFRHGFVTVNRKAVRTPKDLAGKRIGTPLYTQTAALFIRGLLQDEYGVDLSGVHWVQGATNSAESHGHPSAPPLLKPVSIEQNASGRSLSELLEAGEIQAIIGSGLPLALRTNPDCSGCSRIFMRASSTTTGARASSPSCISSPSAVTSTSSIRSSPRVSTRR